jgi:cytochrome c oxidase subunit II
MDLQRRRLLAAGAGAALAGASFATYVLAQPAEQVIRISARKFAFLPGQITLKKGVPVVLEFVSTEVVMGFSAPDFKVRADLIPGQIARVRLVPQTIGTFEYLCDIFCGDGHEGMSGKIHVVA